MCQLEKYDGFSLVRDVKTLGATANLNGDLSLMGLIPPNKM